MAVNHPNDPLDITSDCGDVRCGGFGFIDVEIDDWGRLGSLLLTMLQGSKRRLLGH